MCRLGSLSVQALSKVSGVLLACARWWSVQLAVWQKLHAHLVVTCKLPVQF